MRFEKGDTALNAICPYFTMFPLEFPLKILRRHASSGSTVLDPFCGRGTTNFAARLLGLYSVGVDASPVAAAVTSAKLANVTPTEILDEAKAILKGRKRPEIPDGEFWRAAYHPSTLEAVCRFRDALIADSRSSARRALRGLMLGALHGPVQKTFPSYFSNQCPRTYAPKPGYATRFWASRRMVAPTVDVLDVLSRRARRYYDNVPAGMGHARRADSRQPGALRAHRKHPPFDWVITSPPYYGMRTYIPDQWLRNWFLGGSGAVDYSNKHQLPHQSPEQFAAGLGEVWKNARNSTSTNARLVIRFGGIADRAVCPRSIVEASLNGSGWEITTARKAGIASDGKRQADTFLSKRSKPIEEWVVWARPLS